MPTLHQKSADQLARQKRYLLDPPAGTKAKAAQLHGVDLSLLIEQLNLTPAERAAKLEAATTSVESVRGIARKRA